MISRFYDATVRDSRESPRARATVVPEAIKAIAGEVYMSIRSPDRQLGGDDDVTRK